MSQSWWGHLWEWFLEGAVKLEVELSAICTPAVSLLWIWQQVQTGYLRLGGLELVAVMGLCHVVAFIQLLW